MTDSLPQHGERGLVGRTFAAVTALVLIASGLMMAASSVPESLIKGLSGQAPGMLEIEVMPADPDHQVLCMGAGLSYGSGSSDVVTYGAAKISVAAKSADLSKLDETSALDGFSIEDRVSSAFPIMVSQAAENAPLAAVSYQNLSNLNVRGLAVAECRKSEFSTWLVGGDTTTGRQAAVSISNPGETSALVDIDIWGLNGPIFSPLSKGLLVRAGAQRVLSLAGMAPDESAPVLRVSSSGAAVVATLHASIFRGLEPDGLAVITGQPEPSLERLIPAVHFPPADQVGIIRANEGYLDFGNAIRLLAPHNDAAVDLSVLGELGEETATKLELTAGQVLDFTLDSMATGDKAIVVRSSTPVVAAVRQGTGDEGQTDFSWIGSSFTFHGLAALAVPAEGESRITFVNPSAGPVALSFDGRDVELPSEATFTRPVSGSHEIVSSAPVAAAVSVRDSTAIGNFQVLPIPTPQESVNVSVR